MTKKSIARWISVFLMSTTLCLVSSTTSIEAQEQKTITPQGEECSKIPNLQLLKKYESEGTVKLTALNKSGSVAATYFGQDYGAPRIKKLILWETSGFSQIAEYNINCRDICFGEDENALLFVDPYGIKEMDIRTGEISLVLEGEFLKAAYNPLDNNVIFYSDEVDAYYYNRAEDTSEHLHTVSEGTAVEPFRFYRFTENHLQIMMCRNYTLQIDLRDYTTQKIYISKDDNFLLDLALSPDEKWLLRGKSNHNRLYKHTDYIKQGDRALPVSQFITTDDINFKTLKFLEGDYILCGLIRNGLVEVGDMKTLKKVTSFVEEGEFNHGASIAFHPGKRLIVVASLHGGLFFFRY